ncbi:hypothetical protein AR688_05320 [Rheinheimera sp. EpRS3]|nr:hypothetical protein AR688_05320 [Rheinheimera sp. EpRS3]
MREIVILNDSLLYSVTGSGSNVYGRFDDISSFVTENKIVDAEGIIKSGINPLLADATFSAELSFNDDKMVDNLSNVSIASPILTSFSTSALVAVDNLTDLPLLNQQWITSHFSSFEIDTGLVLRATDINNCDISGTLTEQDNKVFSASLTYSSCQQAGQYEGALWAYQLDDVKYLNWLAFDEKRQFVSGRIDSAESAQEYFARNGNLKAGVHINTAQEIMISKGDQIHLVNIFGSSSFALTQKASEDSAKLEADGRGLYMSRSAVAQFELTFSATSNNLEGKVAFQTDIISTEFTVRNLQPISQNKMLESLAGTWDGLSVTDSGEVSGTVSGCSVTGKVVDYQASVADISMTLSGCDIAGDINGLVAGWTQDSGEVLALSLFNDGAQVQRLSGYIVR